MLSIQVPAEEMSDFAKTAELMARIKNCDISTVHEWQIPCGSGIRMTVKLEGPVGMKAEPRFFDQAIALLKVAKDGVMEWPQDDGKKEGE